MIVGNTSGGTGKREIKMWDNLTVDNNLIIGSNVRKVPNIKVINCSVSVTSKTDKYFLYNIGTKSGSATKNNVVAIMKSINVRNLSRNYPTYLDPSGTQVAAEMFYAYGLQFLNSTENASYISNNVSFGIATLGGITYLQTATTNEFAYGFYNKDLSYTRDFYECSFIAPSGSSGIFNNSDLSGTNSKTLFNYYPNNSAYNTSCNISLLNPGIVNIWFFVTSRQDGIVYHVIISNEANTSVYALYRRCGICLREFAGATKNTPIGSDVIPTLCDEVYPVFTFLGDAVNISKFKILTEVPVSIKNSLKIPVSENLNSTTYTVPNDNIIELFS
jgi:hypothetical protein